MTVLEGCAPTEPHPSVDTTRKLSHTNMIAIRRSLLSLSVHIQNPRMLLVHMIKSPARYHSTNKSSRTRSSHRFRCLVAGNFEISAAGQLVFSKTGGDFYPLYTEELMGAMLAKVKSDLISACLPVLDHVFSAPCRLSVLPAYQLGQPHRSPYAVCSLPCTLCSLLSAPCSLPTGSVLLRLSCLPFAFGSL